MNSDGWISFLNVVVTIQLLFGLLASGIGFMLMKKSPIGVIILIGGIFLSFASIAVIKVFIGMAEDIRDIPNMTVLAESDEAGVFLCMTEDGKQIFVMGHPEYDRVTLHNEYMRDKGKGLEIEVPKNYYKDDNCENKPLLTWRSHANNLYTNWRNYYVYQATPYVLEDDE